MTSSIASDRLLIYKRIRKPFCPCKFIDDGFQNGIGATVAATDVTDTDRQVDTKIQRRLLYLPLVTVN